MPRGNPLEAARCNELLGWFSSSVHIAFAQVWRAERFSRDETVHEAIQSGGREVLAQQFAGAVTSLNAAIDDLAFPRVSCDDAVAVEQAFGVPGLGLQIFSNQSPV